RSPSQRRRVKRQIAAEIAAALGFRMEDGDGEAAREAIAARMRAGDYTGARTLLLETLQTNPGLDGAVEMLAVLEVLCAAPAGRPPHWYRALQVLPGDGAAAIEARHRALLAQLEPVRDALPGADLALRLVDEAYKVLSDPAKRASFDSSNTAGGLVKQMAAGNCSNVASSSKTKRTDHCFQGDDGEFELHEENHADKKLKSVWEKDVYSVSSSEEDPDGCFADLSDAMQDDPCSSQQYDYHNFEEDRLIQQFATGQIWAGYDWEKFPRRYARINKVLTDKMQLYVSWFKPCPQSHEEKNWLSASLPFVCGTFIAEDRQISLSSISMFSHEISRDTLNQQLEVFPRQGEVWAIYSDWDIGWCNNPEMRKKSAFSVVEILTSYSEESGCTVAPLVKVGGFRSVFQRYMRSGREQVLQVCSDNLLMFSHRIPLFRFTHEAGTVLELEHSIVPENLRHQNTLASVTPLSPLSGLDSDTNGFHEAAMAQFYSASTSNLGSGISQQGVMNYNNKLSPEDFMEGQIWAVYDARDRMPRSYVRIIHVVSDATIFVLKLEPHPMLNEEIRWVEDGLPVACGVFRAGTGTTYKDISAFSHPVQCDWSSKKSFYRIFPKKGEIWAMYKNWKITLNSTDIDKCEPRMVEILSDYTDENGVNVCSLTRVKGCLSFFQRALLEGFHLTRFLVGYIFSWTLLFFWLRLVESSLDGESHQLHC
uniref:J domain-containing protein n=1 Tax=Aegilops tauschii subsp. strangulata TaxID=200361 RepID=A0A453GE83_AEGTS